MYTAEFIETTGSVDIGIAATALLPTDSSSVKGFRVTRSATFSRLVDDVSLISGLITPGTTKPFLNKRFFGGPDPSSILRFLDSKASDGDELGG